MRLTGAEREVAGLPWLGWVPVLALVPTWVLALVTAVVGDDQACTPSDPRVCGPDPAFTWAAVVLLATPVLLWWRPLLGCLAGALFASLDIAFDPAPEPRVAFGLHGLACLVVLGLLLRDSRARRAAGGLWPDVPNESAPPLNAARPSRFGPRTGAACVLVLVSAPLFTIYLQQQGAENRHLERARQAEATLARDVDADYRARLRLSDGHEVTVDVIDFYRRGAKVPVLVDPADPGWVRLVAEPADNTGWVTAALGALLAAALLAQADVSAFRARRRLTDGRLGIPVTMTYDGQVRLFAAGAGPYDRPIAVLSAVPVGEPQPPVLSDPEPATPLEEWDDPDSENWTDDDTRAFAQAWRTETGPQSRIPPQRETAVMVGDPTYGGWVALMSGSVTYWPLSPLRRPRVPLNRVLELFGRRPVGEDDPPGAEAGLPGRPVPAAPAVPTDLPWLLQAPRRRRALAALALVAGLLGGPIAVGLRGWSFSTLGPLLAASYAVLWGWTELTLRLRISNSELGIVTTLHRHDLPWEHVLGARVDGDLLWIAWAPDELIDLDGFDGPPPERLAAVIDALRDRAESLGVNGRLPARRLRPEAVALAITYSGLLGAALLLA